MITCPNCGSSLEDGAQFCAYCGNSLQTSLVNTQQIQCRNCGMTVPYNPNTQYTFCPGCGAPYSGQPTQGQMQPVQYQPVYVQQPMVIREVVTEEKKKKKTGCLTWIVLGLILLFIIVPAYNRYKDKSEMENSTSKQSTNKADYSKDITYDELARNPNKYKGSMATYTGEVIQVMESSNKTQIRLATKKNEYFESYTDDIIFCEFSPDIVSGRILEGDIITVYGECNGLYTYTAVLGNEISIPTMIVSMIDISKKKDSGEKEP